MKPLSTGTGLAILGGCILGAAIVSSPGLSSTAIAASTEQRAAPSVVGMHTMRQPMVTTTRSETANLTDCAYRVEHWFSPTPHLINDCAADNLLVWGGCTPTRPQDILGDGHIRNLATTGWIDLSNGVESSFLEVRELNAVSDGNTSVERIAILSSADTELIINLRSLLSEHGYNDQIVIFSDFRSGLSDMDGDGDLDLMFEYGGSRGWLENIAGDSARFSPYDLDHDGRVSTGDLSLLLMEFTD